MKRLASLLVVAMAAFGESPAESSIRHAEQQIAAHPDHAPAYTNLAMAYARRARETSDTLFYSKAEDALGKAAQIAPGDIEVEKARIWLMLGRHEFVRALEAAKVLNRRAPDDIAIWGYLADANVELGNYEAAVEATQWMLRLRAGNVPGLTRAAYLRELHGDIEGAFDLMRRAYEATPFAQTEERAWFLTQLAHLRLIGDDPKSAESYAASALEIFPGYHYALGVLAQVRTAQHRHDEAVALLQQRYEAAPHAENLFALAEALAKAGQTAAAQVAFARFERDALKESNSADNANRELVLYYTDFARQPERALEIARAEIARRHDIFTLDSYAWALAAAADIEGAKVQMDAALATGTRDPHVLEHARQIAGE